MAGFVLDASVAIAGLASDENNSSSMALVERAILDGAVVPALWAYEVANILVMKGRRGAISKDNILLALDLLREFRLTVEAPDPRAGAYRACVELATAHRLTVYDASYLEIAVRRGLPLATLDTKLADAARSIGVVVV
jgi:predicted nucleic acid-binding protein